MRVIIAIASLAREHHTQHVHRSLHRTPLAARVLQEAQAARDDPRLFAPVASTQAQKVAKGMYHTRTQHATRTRSRNSVSMALVVQESIPSRFSASSSKPVFAGEATNASSRTIRRSSARLPRSTSTPISAPRSKVRTVRHRRAARAGCALYSGLGNAHAYATHRARGDDGGLGPGQARERHQSEALGTQPPDRYRTCRGWLRGRALSLSLSLSR